MTRFIVSDGTTQAEEEKAKNFVEKLRLTSVSIVELDQNNKPINHGSACVIKYQNELVLLTVAHVVKEWKKWGVESTDLHHGTKVIFTRDVEYDESVDLACATVNDVGSKSFDQGKTISKNLLIIPNWDNEPSNDERYGFSGIVGTNIDEHYPFENPNMVALRGRCQTCALDYIKRTSRFYVFDFVRERPPAAFVKGCSGAPILDEDGDLIALVEGEGEENKEHLNGIPLATCKDFLQRVRGQVLDKDLKELERIKYLTTGEVEKVFKVIKKSGNVRDLALFSVLYYYGLRSAEAGQLRLQDVNLEDLTIKIWRVKNGISREYPLTPDLKRNIKKYLEIRTDKESPLFVSRKKTKTGGKLSRGRIHTIWKEYAKKAKIDEGKRNVHALRHAIGVHLADAGQSVEFVRQHLGHRRIQNTLVYFQISTARTREIYQELDGKLAKI